MPARFLFEYSIVRAVPKVERGEFINIGVVVYCAQQKFLNACFYLDEKRLTGFSSSIDLAAIRDYLAAYEKICQGGKDSGPIGKLPIAERFHWLTATRSTILQSSPVHTGLCEEASVKLEQLFRQLVLIE